MSTTVALGGMTVTSSTDSAEDISAALQPPEETQSKPKVLVNKGQKVEEEPEKEGISKAASELGKKGGKAAAEARKAAKEDPDEEPEPAEAKAETEEPGEGKEKRPHPGRHDPQVRTAEATRRAREAEDARRASEDRARAAEAKAYQLQERLEAAERARTSPSDGQQPRGPQRDPSEGPAKPEEGDFDRYSDYVEALTDWKADQRDQKRQRDYQIHQMASEAAQRVHVAVTGFTGAIEAAAKEDPEFHGKLSEEIGNLVPSITLDPNVRPSAPNWIADDFLSAPEQAPALMLHLSEHPDEFQRLAALSSPRAITRELARMYAGLDVVTTGTNSRPPVSQAKPPARPVTGSPHTADQELDEDAPLSSFVRNFGQKELKARSR